MSIKKITSTAVIQPPARKSIAWSLLGDFVNYPKFFTNVDKITVRERNGGVGISEWDVTFDGAPITWIQKEQFDEARRQITFRSVSGDFDHFSGVWSVDNSNNGRPSIRLDLEYLLDIPVIETHFSEALQQRLQTNFDAITAAMAAQASKLAIDQRSHRRYPIDCFAGLQHGGRVIDALVVDLSAKGMKLFTREEMSMREDLSIQDITVIPEAVYRDNMGSDVRIIFQDALNEYKVEELANDLIRQRKTNSGMPAVEEIPAYK
jgi:ribosome-associated toxin RatA of RatAB toxin-antitoxin module